MWIMMVKAQYVVIIVQTIDMNLIVVCEKDHEVTVC